MHQIAQKSKPAKQKRKAPHLGRRWQLQDAKARLSQLVKDAQKQPQIITLHGEEVAVVQSIGDYRRQREKSAPQEHFLEALLKCPPGPDLVIHRDPNDTVGALRPNIFDCV